MQYAMTISVAVWTLLAAVVIGLALYRKLVSGGELDLLHVREAEAALIPRQEFRARRLDWIDHWGKLLTVTTSGVRFPDRGGLSDSSLAIQQSIVLLI